jgi:HSP20 family protein
MALPVRHRDASIQPLHRWHPMRELEEVRDQMAQLMDAVWPGNGFGDEDLWSPLVDIEETEDAWIVEAELPGVKRRDLKVEVRDSELEISGEIKERERKGVLRRRTRRTGRFDYRVTLPGATDAENIEANLSDGVLTVRVPKPDQARPRRIEVKSGKA